MKFVFGTGLGSEEVESESLERLRLQKQDKSKENPVCRWLDSDLEKGLELSHSFQVHYVSWHSKGDYFTSLAPTGNTQVSKFLQNYTQT